ncbi:hypothetical protein AC1031_000314 [Aphanomyces cochlioides]|nr:hypothetical protein AC1031_000314 [Aphanomyces cochlioides]
MESQSPVDFEEELLLPEDSFEPDEDHPVVFGIRNCRYQDHAKEYEVQLEKGGTWEWVPASHLLPSEIVYEFEQERLKLGRLNMTKHDGFLSGQNDELSDIAEEPDEDIPDLEHIEQQDA